VRDPSKIIGSPTPRPNHVKNLSDAEIAHAKGQPFVDARCGQYVAQIGAILALLPSPRGALLDAGRGSDWMSIFFATRRYDVVGIDICQGMIDFAVENRDKAGLKNVVFTAMNYEKCRFQMSSKLQCSSTPFIIAKTKSLLWHRCSKLFVQRGVCIFLSEPDTGHAVAEDSKNAVERF
jgi:hypothetical protein